MPAGQTAPGETDRGSVLRGLRRDTARLKIEVYRQRFAAGAFSARLTAHLRLWNSEELDVEVSSSLVESGGQRKTLLSIFRDIAERKQAEVRVAAFSELGQRLSAAKTAREAAEIIVAVADQLLGWDACSFALYSPAEKLMHHVLNRDTVDGRRIESQSGLRITRLLPRWRTARSWKGAS